MLLHKEVLCFCLLLSINFISLILCQMEGSVLAKKGIPVMISRFMFEFLFWLSEDGGDFETSGG